MYAKLEITGVVEVKTGLHIGTSGAFSAIGAVDAPVVRDALSKKPMIPGSSLKGKMRSLLAKEYNETAAFNFDDDCDKLLRLFGSAKKESGYKTGRLLFSDMFLVNEAEILRRGADSPTEIKFENNINRKTAVADPRQIERVIRGSRFGMTLIYEYNGQGHDELTEDFKSICDGLMLLSYDYLGGSGSRGYGRVAFLNLAVKTVIGALDDKLMENLTQMLTKAGT